MKDSKDIIVDLMDALNKLSYTAEVPDYTTGQLIDAHINLIILYCEHLEIDPIHVLQETINSLQEENTSMMFNGIKLDFEN
jgi:hypothetical protein